MARSPCGTYVITPVLSSVNFAHQPIVASLLGVVLIARPQFLFGKQHLTDIGHVVEVARRGVEDLATVTPAQRVGAVGCVVVSHAPRSCIR